MLNSPWPASFVIVTGIEMLAPMPNVPEKEALIDLDAAPGNFGKCNDTVNAASSSTMEGVCMSWVVPSRVTPNVTFFNRFVVWSNSAPSSASFRFEGTAGKSLGKPGGEGSAESGGKWRQS